MNTLVSSKIELMSPVGSFAALQASIDYGADAVYFGVEQLNMRSVSSINFRIEEIPKLVQRCKAKNIKAYLTLNTILYDHDISLMKKIIDCASAEGVDAVIAADQAVFAYAKQKNLPIHISTQQNITNIESVKFYALFAETIVLSRELSLSQIARIVASIQAEKITGPSGNPIQIEIFGHGALCMAVSGKCYLSLHTHHSSANRGACRQNCRKAYKVIDEDGIELMVDNEYIMSPKDLCTLPILDQVIQTGVRVLKIEGRGRAADYAAVTTACYREAIDAYYAGSFHPDKVSEWMKRLESVYHRGFWEGYYLGQHLGEWTKKHPGSQANRKKIHVGLAQKYYPDIKVGQFLIESYDVKQGDKMMVIGGSTGVKEFVLQNFKVGDETPQSAQKGDTITLPLDFQIKKSDKLYKLVDAS